MADDKKELTDTYIDIATDLSVDLVRQKLGDITLHGTVTNQTTYQQKYKGEINANSASLIDLYATPRNTILYKINFIPNSNKTTLRVTNTEYEKRLFAAGLLKGLLIPVGAIILILNIIYYDSILSFSIVTFISLLLILTGVLYKAKPLTHEEYEQDRHIQNFKTAVNGTFIQN